VSVIPSWLVEAARCPDDGGTLRCDDEPECDGVRCERCGERYGVVDGVLVLLPKRLAHLRGVDASATGTERHEDADVRWIQDELEWWNPWHARDPLRPLSPDSGLRGRSREVNLFRRTRPRVPAGGLAIEMGAGTSRTVAGLWPPKRTGLRYIATDVSLPALKGGRRILGPSVASVQCDAVEWPFRPGVADVVLVLGVLHHLSDWRSALERAALTVRGGGFLVLHEVVEKPRVLARFRSGGFNDSWVSPHEGDVPASEIRAVLERHGRVLLWRGEESPLRFALVKYLVERRGRYERLEASPGMTAGLNALDQAFGRCAGRLSPSLGFHEVMAVWQRRQGAP
jgi:SAM-dependent methyltransferase